MTHPSIQPAVKEENIQRYIAKHDTIVSCCLGISARAQKLERGKEVSVTCIRNASSKRPAYYSAPWRVLDCDSLIRLIILLGELNHAQVTVYTIDVRRAGNGYVVSLAYAITPLSVIGVDTLSPAMATAFVQYNEVWEAGLPVTIPFNLVISDGPRNIVATNTFTMDSDTFSPELFVGVDRIISVNPAPGLRNVPVRCQILAGDGFYRLAVDVEVVSTDSE